MSRMISIAQEYISRIMGNKMTYREIGFPDKLPVYFTREYALYECSLFNVKFLLMEGSFDEVPSIPALKKRLELVKTGLDVVVPVAFLAEQIDWYTRSALVKHNISFVEPEKQLYLPFLGVAFTDSFSLKKPATEELSPATQSLLFTILGSPEKNLIVKELEKEASISRMSIYRGLDELADLGLLERDKVGKHVSWYFELSKEAFWNSAKKFLIDPVVAVHYAIPKRSCYIPDKHLVLAGESALEKYSLISNPGPETFAVSSKEWSLIKEEFELVKYRDESVVIIEVWNQKPPVRGNILHPLALYLTLKDEVDERIQMGLEDIMTEYDWGDAE